MKTTINKFILAGWGLYLVSLFMPWSSKLFSGWLYGWMWQGMNFFPLYYLITILEFKSEYLGVYTQSLAILIMLASPLLLVVARWGNTRLATWLIHTGFILALLSLVLTSLLSTYIPHPAYLFRLGYCVFVASFGMLSLGFHKLHAQVLTQHG